jgi:hypothetical protein
VKLVAEGPTVAVHNDVGGQLFLHLRLQVMAPSPHLIL